MTSALRTPSSQPHRVGTWRSSARSTLDSVVAINAGPNRMMPMTEFQEIAHCGGQFTVNIKDEDGRRSVAFGVRHSRPTPARWFAIYCLPQGVPVGTIQLGGIGDAWNPAPHASTGFSEPRQFRHRPPTSAVEGVASIRRRGRHHRARHGRT
jgi:hypothetical protein